MSMQTGLRKAMEQIVRKSYHTHTFRCHHAEGDVMDYCQAAMECGMTVLGFTDHTPLPDGRWPHVRMQSEELPAYLGQMDYARAAYSELTIIKGLECEFAREYVSFFRDELLGRFELDYLINGQHWFLYHNEWMSMFSPALDTKALHAYADMLIAAMESELFTFIAHPDSFGYAYPEWDAEVAACSHAICSAARTYDMPLELNAYGLRKAWIDTQNGRRAIYPWEPFWEIAAEYGIRVVVNADAHRPQDVCASMQDAAAIAAKYNLSIADLSHLETPCRTNN